MKKNPSNPADVNKGEVRQVSPKSFEKARVIELRDRDEGFHTAVVKLYDSGGQTTAPVLTQAYGDVALPEENTDVMVMFGERGEEIIIGSWYPIDRVLENQIQLAEYNAGDRIVGNGTASYLRIHSDGTVDLKTDDDSPINIDHQSFSAYLSGTQTIGNNSEAKIQFNEVRNNAEGMFDTATHEATVLDGGIFRATGTAEIQNAGQNKQYVLRIRNQDGVIKRLYAQSTNKAPLTLQISTTIDLDANDTVWLTIENRSSSSREVNGGQIGSEFEMRRLGDGS